MIVLVSFHYDHRERPKDRPRPEKKAHPRIAVPAQLAGGGIIKPEPGHDLPVMDNAIIGGINHAERGLAENPYCVNRTVMTEPFGQSVLGMDTKEGQQPEDKGIEVVFHAVVKVRIVCYIP